MVLWCMPVGFADAPRLTDSRGLGYECRCSNAPPLQSCGMSCPRRQLTACDGNIVSSGSALWVRAAL
jgi:hypothetical protein